MASSYDATVNFTNAHDRKNNSAVYAINVLDVFSSCYTVTICGKTFEWENFRGCAQNTLFTGKLSWCIRP